MFCFTRPTVINAFSGATSASSFVPTTSPPMFVLAMRPLIFVPAMIGTSRPSTRPTRRLKNGMTSSSSPRPKEKMSAPSRKNVRFSGKNSGKRVRLVRRVSTSVSAKSVLTVSDASRLAPRRCVTSRLG